MLKTQTKDIMYNKRGLFLQYIKVLQYNSVGIIHAYANVLYKSCAIRLNHSFKYILNTIRECPFNHAHASKYVYYK